VSKAETETTSLIDERMALAIGHPLRVQILVEVDRAAMSPAEFTAKNGGSLPQVAYHFRVLQKCGCLTQVATRQRRGATEHIFEVTQRAFFDAATFAELPAPIRGGFSASILTSFMDRATEALEADTLDSHASRHLTWAPLKLDEEGFGNVMAMFDDLFHRLHVEQMAAAQRMSDSGEPPIHTTVGMAGFESPAPKRDHAL
jgi:hypothetical protein